MITLEELLKTPVKMTNGKKFIPDFRVAVQEETPSGVHIIIHPSGHNGTTLDFRVKGNKLIAMRGILPT